MDNKGDVWFVYDGACPICNTAAKGFRIKEAVGNLHLINARSGEDHAVLQEIKKRGLDLDEGMVITFGDSYYHGADALHIMAMLGTNQGWFNRLNYLLFRSKHFAKWCYPAFRAARNLAIRLKGVPDIDNLRDEESPTFKSVFGKDWERLPPVIRARYANRPYSADKVTVEGYLDVSYSPFITWLLPLFKLFGALMPYRGSHIPTTVHFFSEPQSNAFGFDRILHYPDKEPHHFRSVMYPYKAHTVIEYIRFGVGVKLAYRYDGKDTVYLEHQGYCWNIGGMLLPLPLSLIFGKAFGEEIAVSDDTFTMKAGTRHRLFGAWFEYKGSFRVTGKNF